MAKNDAILIDGILADRKLALVPSADLGEVFEFLCIEQILKNYDLTKDEIESGWIDGRNDGGIDAFYLFVNGHLLTDAATFVWPRSGAEISLHIISCKHHETFKEATLNSVAATVNELLDFSAATTSLKGSYSKALQAARERFIAAYRRLAITNPSLHIQFTYASRGDSLAVGESIRARAEQILSTADSYFSDAKSQFAFFGAKELVDEYRKQKTFTITLPFDEALSGTGKSHIVTTKLGDYYKFISDDTGALRRYLFDSNVRDYLGSNRVNEDIEYSLRDESAADFWWLNNGITILGSNATVTASKQLLIKDIQIVNGLQTTETIYRHFAGGDTRSANRTVAIKVIVSEDATMRDRIIRATNNQSSVDLASLHATDKIQRDIEQILERSDWYYERRMNYFRNIGRPQEKFVTPMYLAGGFVSIVMRNPAAAANLKPKFMNNSLAYSMVFSERASIEIWPIIASVLKSAESALANTPKPTFDRFLKSWRGLLGMASVARALGTFAYNEEQLLGLDVSKVDVAAQEDVWKEISSIGTAPSDRRKPSFKFVGLVCERLSQKFGIQSPQAVGVRGLPSAAARTMPLPPAQFIEQVRALLPPQPFPTGIHLDIAEKLSCSGKDVSSVITMLMEKGELANQRDGVLFDKDWKLIAPT